MLWVELAKHGGDAAAGDGLAAPCAGCSPHLVVVVLAVGETVVLEKVAVREGLVALPESDPNTQRNCRIMKGLKIKEFEYDREKL